MNKSIKWILFPALVIQFVGAYGYFILSSDSYSVQALYTLTKVLIVCLPLLSVWLGLSLAPLLKKSNIKKSIAWGLVSGGLISLLIIVIFFLFKENLLESTDSIVEKVNSFGLMSYYILFAFFLSIIHSFIEEYYWRWFVFGGLEKNFFSPIFAGVVMSIAFASHHFIILSQFFPPMTTIIFGLGVGMGGAIWAWLTKKTNNILASWISHAMVDGAVMLIGYWLIFT